MGPNRYGKSGIRLAVVVRDGTVHHFTDLELDVRLHGDFAASYEAGENAEVLPTDTMRGTCFALARDGIGSVAGFGARLAARFLEASARTSVAVVTLRELPWQRVAVDGAAHGHTFTPAAGGTPVTTVRLERGRAPAVVGGISGARVAKTTGSAFGGFLRDEYTTLPETRDRIMATTVDARWGTAGADVDHAALALGVPATFLAAFARHDGSESVQHTLHAMGTAVLAAHPDVTWIRFLLPNEHHVLADLSAYGLDNPGVVFHVTDRPFGVIEGAVARDGVTAEVPW